MTDYSARQYQLSPEFVKSLFVLRPWRSTLALGLGWAALIGLIVGMRALPTDWFWTLWIPASFLIAGRFGVLLQLVHEGSHRLLAKKKSTNDLIAKWFCGLPLGVFFSGYLEGHLRHHSGTNTEMDPPSDTEKYRITDTSDPKLYLLFAKDFFGLTALSIFFAYQDPGKSAQSKSLKEKILPLAQLAFVQLILILGLFQGDVVDYLLLWIFPAISSHMCLMRVRGMAEHGLARQKGVAIVVAAEGNFHTRSFLTSQNSYRFPVFTWLEKILIGSLSVHHHHEHHLLPTVPFYHLKLLHAAIGSQAKALHPDIYEKGYFSAAFFPAHQTRSLRRAKTVPT